MPTNTKIAWAVYWLVVAAMFAGVSAMLAYYTPTERTMGDIQKLFYLHLPSAINAFVACFAVFVASVAYFWRQQMKWDDLGVAAAKVAVLMCSIVLVTGMIWGKVAWGAWWSWTPRLTFSLLLWLLYVVYLLIRPSIESAPRRAMVSSIYGIAAFLDVPLVYLSTRLIKDPIHPVSVPMDPEMKLTLAAWFVPVTLATLGLIVVAYRSARAKRIAAEAAAADE